LFCFVACCSKQVVSLPSYSCLLLCVFTILFLLMDLVSLCCCVLLSYIVVPSWGTFFHSCWSILLVALPCLLFLCFDLAKLIFYLSPKKNLRKFWSDELQIFVMKLSKFLTYHFIFIFKINSYLWFFQFCVYILFAFIALHCFIIIIIIINLLLYVVGCVRVFGYWKKVACFTFIIHLHLFHDV